MRPAEIIREARNVLFERGWTKGQFENDRGEVCIRGALSVATCGDAERMAWANPASPFVKEALSLSTLFVWNDDRNRTFNEVIDALDRAEKIAESREVEAADVRPQP